eukprot:scaffold77428_cov32-Prasinocladus_malaysianus.AAC.1
MSLKPLALAGPWRLGLVGNKHVNHNSLGQLRLLVLVRCFRIRSGQACRGLSRQPTGSRSLGLQTVPKIGPVDHNDTRASAHHSRPQPRVMKYEYDHSFNFIIVAVTRRLFYTFPIVGRLEVVSVVVLSST